ncbi:hypothetical protein HHI36_022610 [Cryptolaemus montrouzieri]|uniref:Peptidase S1 domain-containing protein n=1 Tax=Cryptolaemus montrouzieri TaxID=559131 RepID=A0ABD2N137_9CUCU
MCNCGHRKINLKLSLLILWVYFQLAFCGLKLLKQLTHRQLFNGQNTNLLSNSNRSPCPNIFEYRYDNVGRLYGFMEIRPPNSRTITVSVEFCVGNRVDKGAEGSISLPYPNTEQIIDTISQGRPLNYNINFPTWRGLQPKITKILVNGNLVCSDVPYSVDSVPILTTINLLYQLHVDLRQQGPSVKYPPIDINSSNGADINTSFDVRNDRRRSTTENPYNFSPDYPKTVPEIVYKPDIKGNDSPYPNNPFFLSTRSPNANNGGVIFNSPFEASTIEYNIIDITPKSTPTQAPVQRWSPPPEQSDGTSQYYNDVCGRPVVTNSLILNGRNVPRGAFPWLVAMFMKTNVGLEYQCTGSLVSKRLVVTAAHCVKHNSIKIDPENIVLVMGRLNILSWGGSEDEKIMTVEDTFIHPKYKSSTADADISVILLKTDVIFTKFIRPICLWDSDTDLNLVVGKTGTVVGWGKDENGRKVSSEPKLVELPIVSQEQCLRSNYSYSDITSERTFCAGKRDGTGPCNGDSGSGFVMFKDRRWYLKGITSMSLSSPLTRTCDLYNYVVFTDASKYADWILGIIQ